MVVNPPHDWTAFWIIFVLIVVVVVVWLIVVFSGSSKGTPALASSGAVTSLPVTSSVPPIVLSSGVPVATSSGIVPLVVTSSVVAAVVPPTSTSAASGALPAGAFTIVAVRPDPAQPNLMDVVTSAPLSTLQLTAGDTVYFYNTGTGFDRTGSFVVVNPAAPGQTNTFVVDPNMQTPANVASLPRSAYVTVTHMT